MRAIHRVLFLLLLVLVTSYLIADCNAQADEGGQATVAAPSAPAAEPAAGIAGAGSQTTDLVVAIFKVLGALALVVGLMVLLAFFFRKMGMANSGFRKGSLITVVDTRMIAPKKYVAVLKIGPEYVVVGITDQNISLLNKLEDSDELKSLVKDTLDRPAMPLASSFASLLQKAAKSVNTKKSDSI